MISFVTMAVKISQGCMNWFGNEAMIVSFILYRMYGVRAPYGAGFVRRLAQARNPLQCLNEKELTWTQAMQGTYAHAPSKLPRCLAAGYCGKKMGL